MIITCVLLLVGSGLSSNLPFNVAGLDYGIAFSYMLGMLEGWSSPSGPLTNTGSVWWSSFGTFTCLLFSIE